MNQTARLMLYVLMAVVLMALDHRGNYVPGLRSLALYLAEPVYHVVEWPFVALGGAYSQFQLRRSLQQENEALKLRLLDQQAALQRLDALTQENRRLRALVNSAQSLEFELQFAELISVDLDPFSHRVVIDRGSVDGVHVGQAVIDGDGVMGQVEDVQIRSASVRLISDPNHALPVQVNRTGLRTVAFGSGETGRLMLPSVPHQADVRTGDLLVTSGLGNRFPGGYPVATVSRIDRHEGGTFIQLEAAPLASLDRGSEVLLIRVTGSDVEAAGRQDADDAVEPGEVEADVAAPTAAPAEISQDPRPEPVADREEAE